MRANQNKDIGAVVDEGIRLASERRAEATAQADRAEDDIAFLRAQQRQASEPCPHCGSRHTLLWVIAQWIDGRCRDTLARTNTPGFESHLCYACSGVFSPQTDEQKVAATNALLGEIRDLLLAAAPRGRRGQPHE